VDAKWRRRELIEQELQGDGPPELEFDPEEYRYRYQTKLFTGTVVERYPDGTLQGYLQFVDGLAHGVSVMWFPNGQLRRYMELEYDACHGLKIEWSDDGVVLFEGNYCRGRLVK